MSRRALRTWARQQRRLVVLLRTRHPLLRRLPPGRLILETLGLVAPHRAGLRPRERFWLPREVEPEVPELGIEEWQAEQEQVQGPAPAPPALAERPATPEQPTGPAAEDRGLERPRRVLPVNWPSERSRGGGPLDREPEIHPGRASPARQAESSAPGGPESQTPPSSPRSAVRAATESDRAESIAEAAATPGLPEHPEPTAAPSAHDADARTNQAQPQAEPVAAPIAPAPHDQLPRGPAAEPTEPAAVPPETSAARRAEPPATPAGRRPAHAFAPTTRPEDQAAHKAPSSEDEPAHVELSSDASSATPTSAMAETESTPKSQADDRASAAEEPAPREPAPRGPQVPPRVIEQRQARRAPAVGVRPARPSSGAGAGTEARPPEPPRSGAPEADEKLFTRAEGRAITEWRRLLIEATTEGPATRTQPATPKVPRPPSAGPSVPEPVSQSARRFLRPLVGIDPNTVRVRRGAEARATAEMAGAEALTVGEEVVFPAPHDERTPEGLGLLAHELTHVARRRSPRFVPPIGREKLPSVGTQPREDDEGQAPRDEEHLARRVEGRVRAEARAETQASGATEHQAVPSTARRRPEKLSRKRPHPLARDWDQAEAEEESEAPWGDLPAPWEPLPAVGSVGSGPTSSGNGSTATTAATVQRAEPERTVEEPPPALASAQTPVHKESAPPPDLDALARQVYDVLKRRLAADRRREG